MLRPVKPPVYRQQALPHRLDLGLRIFDIEYDIDKPDRESAWSMRLEAVPFYRYEIIRGPCTSNLQRGDGSPTTA